MLTTGGDYDYLKTNVSSSLIGKRGNRDSCGHGDFFKDLLGDIKDQKERDFFERHRDDAKWDGKHYYDRENNKRYTRDEWRKEMQWRYNEEKSGRDWREKRYGKKKDDKRQARKDERRDNKRRNDKRKDKRNDERRKDPRH